MRGTVVELEGVLGEVEVWRRTFDEDDGSREGKMGRIGKGETGRATRENEAKEVRY